MPFLRSVNYPSCIAWGNGDYSPKEVKRISGKKLIYMSLVQHEKAATFLDILKSFFRPTLVRV